MKALLTILLCAFAAHIATAQTPGLAWAKSYGADGYADENTSFLAVDGDGNVYRTGYFRDTVDFDPGPGTVNLVANGELDDAFVLKLDAAGNFLWVKQFGSASRDNGYGIAVDASGNVYVTGDFFNDIDMDPGPGTYILQGAVGDFNTFICKLTTDGDLVWAIALPGPSTEGNSIALDAKANVHVLGSFNQTIDFDPGPGTYALTPPDSADSYILKLDSSGKFIWARSMSFRDYETDSSYDAFRIHIAVDAAGGVYTTGSFDRTGDFDPGPAKYELTAAGIADAYISKLDSEGNFVWARRVGGIGDDSFMHLALDDRYLYATGFFEGTVDFDPGSGIRNLTAAYETDASVLKLEAATGEYVWATHFGGMSSSLPGGAYAGSIDLDQTGNMYVGGMITGTADLDPGPGVAQRITRGRFDMFLVKLNPAGDLLWSWGAGSNHRYDWILGVEVDANGSVHVDGIFGDTVDFDPCPTTHNLIASKPGRTSSFIAKLHQNGCESSDAPLTLSSGEFSLAPNPTTSSATLRSAHDLRGATVRLQNIRGEPVREWKDIRGASFTIDLGGQPTGIYFVEVVIMNEVKRLRVVRL